MKRFPSAARLTAGAVLFGLLLAGLAARPAAAQTPPAPSPEELTLGLQPYLLTANDIPAGYEITGSGSVTPAALAYQQSNTASEGQSVLRSVSQAGILAGIEQQIDPKPASAVRRYVYTVRLFDTSTHAATYMHNTLDSSGDTGVQVTSESLPVALGDESGGLHVVLTDSSGIATGIEYVYWRRGRVLLRMGMEVADLTESIDQVLPFAQAADARAAKVTAPAPQTQATLAVTSSESTRVAAAYALFDRLPADSFTPAGLMALDPFVISNADLLLDKSDPTSAYTSLITNTGRIVGIERDFGTLQAEGNDIVAVQYVLCATTQGAQVELQNPFDGDTTISIAHTYALPKPLGDSSALLEGTVTFKSGTTATALAVVWTHGDVVLKTIAFSPSTDIGTDQIIALATQVDAGFSRTALPAVLTNPNASSANPSGSPTAPSNPVQAWSPLALLGAHGELQP
jgi:hypothetical protein